MGTVRTATADDLASAVALCAADPVANLFVAARIARGGVERQTLGCDVLCHVDDSGRITSLLHVGANLVPVNVAADEIEDYALHLGPYRVSSSIMGPAASVVPLHRTLARMWGRSWARSRDERPNQPLLVIERDPLVAPAPQVRRIREEDFEAYFAASVSMYTEEVGVSPLGPDHGYRQHVWQTVREGRAHGIVVDGRVVYKSDVGAAFARVAQIQGVWLDPSLRGRHLAAPAMAAVVAAVRETYPTVSLYVNDYNAPALALYRRVGFEQAGTFATILY